MPNELILLFLRFISALLLLVMLGFLFRFLWREQRLASADVENKRRHFGNLVMLREIDGHMHLTGEKFPLKPITSLGRAPTNSVIISDNFASSEHALVTLRQGQWWLEDRNSRNGTLINNIPVKQPVVISEGDIIGIGQIRLRLELEN
ncbi:MAG: FHA domain-containing protein [Chloroflexi bacterium]|nr:FHA domain-containing protein [Chloroflexota bacterium]MCC6893571.1 FHA domain-containing protein [Anaerolineae bacterium]